VSESNGKDVCGPLAAKDFHTEPSLPEGADRRVDFETIAALALAAKEMNSKYKETSEGGLAVSVVLC
jgi:hypothetical protein